MNADAAIRSVAPGDETLLEAAWRIKRRIARTERVLDQSREYFAYEYRTSTAHVRVADCGRGRGRDRARSESPGSDEGPESAPDALGFAVVDADGYLSLLGVDPDRRHEGIGTRLVEAVADDRDAITCHVRASNDAAVAFYDRLGFAVERRIESYYPDGDDAYALALRDEPSRGSDT